MRSPAPAICPYALAAPAVAAATNSLLVTCVIFAHSTAEPILTFCSEPESKFERGTHGPSLDGYPLLGAHTQEESRIRLCRDSGARSRHRRHHGDLQCRECGAHSS